MVRDGVTNHYFIVSAAQRLLQKMKLYTQCGDNFHGLLDVNIKDLLVDNKATSKQ